MLRLDAFTQTEQIFSIDHGPSIALNHISVEATLIIDDNYHNQIRRILKKSLPPSVQIQLLYTPNDVSRIVIVDFDICNEKTILGYCETTTVVVNS